MSAESERAAQPPPIDDEASISASPLARIALQGVAWNWAGSAILILAQVASTAATARLVSPSEFGLYASALAASGIAGYFTLVGLGPGLQRRSELGARSAGTAMTLSLSASLLVAVLLWICASLWARAWGVPDADWVIRIIAVTLLLTSSSIVPMALIRRRLRFKLAALLETSALVVGLAVGVGLAVWLHSAIALAAGQAIGAAAQLLAVSVISRRDLRLAFDSTDARELLAFASQVGGFNLVAYFAYTAPSWFAARTFGAASLGFYSRANLVVGLPAEYALTSIFKIIFPVYGRVRKDLRRTRTLIGEALTLTTGLLWPALALVAGAAPVIVAVLLGARWDDAVPLVSLFALSAAAWVPCGVLTNAAEALGWMRIIAARQVALLAGVVATLVVVHLAGLGLSWVLAGVAATEWIAYALTLQPFIQRGVLTAGPVLRTQLIHGAIAVTVFGASAGAAAGLADASLLAQLAAQVLIGLVVLAILALGRTWIPATEVFARRIGVSSDQNILRTAWTGLS